MKTEKLLMLCMVLFFMQLVACERSKMDQVAPVNSDIRTGASEDSASSRIATDKVTGIKQKEPINFTLTDAKSTSVVWRVSPAQTVINMGAKSQIYFQNAGNFRVMAVDSMSFDTAYIDVNVTNEIYSPPSGNQVFKENEILRITPAFRSDTNNILMFTAITTNSYNCVNNQLLTYSERTGDLFKLDYQGIITSLMCDSGEKKPESMRYFVNPTGQAFEGKIEILFNNKTYKGSFKKSGAKYEFDWPYESGVVFTTKSI
ncbi:hypothetical protein [Dyadobacter luticola]|uniref:Uncharacterized protein n=1 Tax=Dyadobacter luticola TaxID=1979387 RepID=A0A5R9KRP4_9BACT|nr:hypothetical protein [Dyadobacter luticola]TLU98955.1 hypothetical protein FEN17_20410 [Dyadobacter luticola]